MSSGRLLSHALHTMLMAPILIAGVHAAGKSTVGRDLSSLSGYPVFEYADFMLPVIGTSDRSKILMIPFAQRGPLYRAANAQIAGQFATNSTVTFGLLTIHLSIYLNGRIETFTDDHYLSLQPRGILQIECEPELIFERRRADTSRFRTTDSVAEISRQQLKNKSIAAHVSKLCRAPIFTLNNSHHSPNLISVVRWLECLDP